MKCESDCAGASMTCTSHTNADGNPCRAAAASAGGPSLRICAAICWLLAVGSVDAAMAADLFDDSFLRGSFSNPFTSKPVRWDGVNFGAHIGVGNLNTDFGTSTGSLVAYILRNSTLETEASPSSWTTLPSNTTNGRSYGAFLGYNYQWTELVLGFDLAYNRLISMDASASDSIRRIVTTSDAVQHDVTISAQSSLKLIDYATLRARAGYAFGQFLPYAFAGGAVGRFNYSNSATVTDIQTVGGVVQPAFIQSGSDSKNGAIVAGFTGGLGMDVALLPNVFLRAEWEFVGFGKIGGILSNMNTGRVGLGARF